MELTDSQNKALCALLNAIDDGQTLVSLSGSAGTGKTTIIKRLKECLESGERYDGFSEEWDEWAADQRVVTVATPTNKAAQVLTSKGIEAATFYRTFYRLEDALVDEKTKKSKPVFISCARWLQQQSSLREAEFELQNQGKVAFADVLIIDEASLLTHRRIRELRGMCRVLILVGDHHQLPPVGDRDFPEGYFTQLYHTATLTEIMRQKEGSLILALADELRQDGPRVDKMLRHFEPQDSFVELIRGGAQAIAFANKERQRINHVARKILGFTGPLPAAGDRMLVTNNFSDVLVNGTVITVRGFEWDGFSTFASLTIDLDGEDFTRPISMSAFARDQIASVQSQLDDAMAGSGEPAEDLLCVTYAYCMTAHKAQGSEWDTVVVFDQRGLIKKIQSGDANSGLPPDEYVRRWTYTAITRARKGLAFVPTWFAKSY